MQVNNNLHQSDVEEAIKKWFFPLSLFLFNSFVVLRLSLGMKKGRRRGISEPIFFSSKQDITRRPIITVVTGVFHILLWLLLDEGSSYIKCRLKWHRRRSSSALLDNFLSLSYRNNFHNCWTKRKNDIAFKTRECTKNNVQSYFEYIFIINAVAFFLLTRNFEWVTKKFKSQNINLMNL